MKTVIFIFFILFFFSLTSNAQQNYNSLNVKDLAISSQVNVTSTTKSSKPCPAMTETQRNAIVSPSNGSCVYNTTTSTLNVYNGTIWKSAGGGISNWSTGFVYSVDDVVIESQRIYQCLIAHTSGTFSTDLSASRWQQISDASDIGLGSVNNTSDLNKPISTATQSALNLKSNIASPAFTGNVTAPLLNVTSTVVHEAAMYEGYYTDSATTGANATITDQAFSNFYLTNSSLTSVDMFGAGSYSNARVVTLVNKTGNDITFNNDTGATSAHRILTGTSGPFIVQNGGSVTLKYDVASVKWRIDKVGPSYAFGNLISTQHARLTLSGTTASGAKVLGALTESSGSGLFSYNSGTGDYTCLVTGNYTINVALRATTTTRADPTIVVNGNQVGRDTTDTATSTSWASASFSGLISSGQAFHVINQGTGASDNAFVSVTASINNPSVVTSTETFSSDTASFVYANAATYTDVTLANAPVGTYITWTYTASSNSITQTTGANRPTQTDADMKTNGIRLYLRAYASASTAALPSRVAIQVGKNFKGVSTRVFKGSGKSIPGDLDFFILGSANEYGIPVKQYDPTTGVLTIDAGWAWNGSATTVKRIIYNDRSETADGFFTVDASKNPALTGVNQLIPRIATISDVKSSGTPGGASTATTNVTRVLNTLVDNQGVGVTLASNQFTLQAGTYYIEASSPAHNSVSAHKVRIRNITDSSTSIIGSSEFAATNVQNRSHLSGEIIITGAKTFELQHYTTGGVATNGLGVPVSSGESEVYSIVKITKVK